MKQKLRLATTTGDIEHMGFSVGECVDFICDAGFENVDISFYHMAAPGSVMLSDSWKSFADEAKAAAEKRGAGLIQAHSPAMNCFDMRGNREAYERGILATVRSIQVCGIVGIPAIVVHPGYAVCGKDEYFEVNRKFFEDLLPAAEENGVKLCAENSAEGNMGDNHFFFDAEEMIEFFDYMDNHPLMAACWDTGHANMRHMDQGHAIRTLGSKLGAMHIQDNFGVHDDHLAPLQGTTDFNDILRAVYDIGYTGAFALEADNVICKACGWPNYRPSNGPVSSPRLSVWKKSEELLFAIGTQLIEAEF